jgi:hypothetical protein
MDLTGPPSTAEIESEKRKTDATDVADPDTTQAGAPGQAGPGRHRPPECGQPARPDRVHDRLPHREQDHPNRRHCDDCGGHRDHRDDGGGLHVGGGVELDFDGRTCDDDTHHGGEGGHALDDGDHGEPWQLRDGFGRWVATPT